MIIRHRSLRTRAELLLGALIASSLVVLTGCTSSPAARHYLLEAQVTPVAAEGGVSLGLHPVVVPEYLQRSNLLLDASDGVLRYSQSGRWGEPLDDAIHRVSQLQLATALGSGDFRSWPWSAAQRPDWEVRITVLALERRAGTAQLTAELAVRDNRAEPQAGANQSAEHGRTDDPAARVWRRRIDSWQAPSGDDSEAAIAASYSALVQAMNADLAALLDPS